MPTEKEIQEAIQIAIHLDPSLEAVLEFIQRDHSITPALVKAKFKDYKLQVELLLYNGKIMVPDDENIKRDLVTYFHDSPLAGHPGRNQILKLVSRNYYWPGMKALVNKFIETCKVCQQIHQGHPRNYKYNH